MTAQNILILGGTKEAAALASRLVAKGHNVTSSLAGRTKEPAPLEGKVRVGGFGGVDGLARWIEQKDVTRLIDATHPFAEQISENARKAAKITGVKFEVCTRAPWQRQPDDIWIKVENLDQAVREIPPDARVLLALGSQHLSAFKTRKDVHFIIRMIDEPEKPPGFGSHTLILGKPSLRWRDEADLMKREKITHVVCRNSGGDGAYAKIRAARELGLSVIIVDRPKN